VLPIFPAVSFAFASILFSPFSRLKVKLKTPSLLAITSLSLLFALIVITAPLSDFPVISNFCLLVFSGIESNCGGAGGVISLTSAYLIYLNHPKILQI
jgi:hypothetical protein